MRGVDLAALLAVLGTLLLIVLPARLPGARLLVVLPALLRPLAEGGAAYGGGAQHCGGAFACWCGGAANCGGAVAGGGDAFTCGRGGAVSGDIMLPAAAAVAKKLEATAEILPGVPTRLDAAVENWSTRSPLRSPGCCGSSESGASGRRA